MASSGFAVCNSKFLNPVMEICWDCLFPISIGSLGFGGTRPDTPNQALPFCFCPGMPLRPGAAIGMWEPAYLVDVANEPGCFVNMGFNVHFGLFNLGKSTINTKDGTAAGSKWQVHLYQYPLVSWLGVLKDTLCFAPHPFDIAYISEIDLFWKIPEPKNFVNSEGILFANPIAQPPPAEIWALMSSSCVMDVRAVIIHSQIKSPPILEACKPLKRQ